MQLPGDGVDLPAVAVQHQNIELPGRQLGHGLCRSHRTRNPGLPSSYGLDCWDQVLSSFCSTEHCRCTTSHRVADPRPTQT